MKNLFAIVALVGMFAIVSCGGKKEEKKVNQDSLDKVKADSLAAIAKADSLKEVARLDSIKKAEEEAANAPKTGGTKVTTGGNTGTTVSTNKGTVTVNTGKPVRGGR